jgi:hypothetical protein
MLCKVLLLFTLKLTVLITGNCALLSTGFTVLLEDTVCHLSSIYILVSQPGPIYESFR